VRQNAIPGYDYDTDRVPHSPVTLQDLAELKATVGFTEEDQRYLALAGETLAPQAEAMVDAWRAKIGRQPHLAKWFFRPDGQPDERYKAAVKPRFVQWVIDTCTRPFEQAWLDYQEEIGLRHTPGKKNLTDQAQAPPLVPLRYVLAFTAVIVTTTRDFLAASGASLDQVEGMHAAWTKAVLLSITLWSRPYTKDEWW
jgi:hypothetical protein